MVFTQLVVRTGMPSNHLIPGELPMCYQIYLYGRNNANHGPLTALANKLPL